MGCGGSEWPLCGSCRPLVATLEPPGCARCGRPLEAGTGECSDCPPPQIRWARGAFLYEGPVRKALMALKFGGKRSVAPALAPAMANALSTAPGPGTVLTWVPLAPRRRRERGYDQAEVLARALGRATGLPVIGTLERVLETAPQARRDAAHRRRALRGAFRALPERASGALVLVDDVLTTGATAAECASVLSRAGAEEVGLLTAARSLGGGVPARCYNPPGLRPGSVVARETSSR